jgi:2,3-bisphosphoglycerate-independent phosphoglycerate mutase
MIKSYFFLNGGIERPFYGEDRILIPSPDVATYDLKPEMSIFELTDELAENIESQKYDLIICNFANTDMVGHSGKLGGLHLAMESISDLRHKMGAQFPHSRKKLHVHTFQSQQF